MRLVFLYGLLLAWNQDAAVASVRITELRVEAHIAEGGTALLGCKFHMEDDTLYSLKWYKDGREFYRYVPKAAKPTQIFYVPGVNVDVSHSSTNFVTLKNFARESAGVYRCEVYGEAPRFTMVYRQKHVAVDLLPKSGPIIVGLEKEYVHGSKMDVNCTTEPSRPEAQLAWFINELPAPKAYIRGPMLVMPTSRPFTYQAKLNLHFTVYQSHFLHGILTIKPSRPEAQLAWFINELPAPKAYLRGLMLVMPTSRPFSYQAKLNLHFTVYTTEPSRTETQLAWFINKLLVPNRRTSEALCSSSPLAISILSSYQAKLNLHFTVYQSHFLHGVLTIKCQATIPPLYNNETKVSFYDQSLMTSLPSPVTDSVPDHASTSAVSIICVTAQMILWLVI